MLRRIIHVGLGVIAGYLMALGVAQVVTAWGLWPDRETERAAAQVSQVMRLINKHYVDKAEAGGAKLADHAIESMVGGLDPYSQFLTPRSYRQLEEEVDGAYGGVGVQVEDVGGRITVVAPIAGTPGERAGILRGDVLVKVDELDVRGLKLDEFIGKLRGKPGTPVRLTLERGEPAREIVLSLKREVIKVESVRDAELRADGIGYVRVTMFADKTGADFKAAVKGLKERGAKALVIDLRNNPGGLITGAVEMVEPFFPRGELVVYVQGRDAKDRIEWRAQGEKEPWRVPLAVLVNSGSASASEIVAGALKDTKRAVLVGEKTFGKGSVQQVFPLKGNAGLRLTTARYYTPSGKTIHERGIRPDVKNVLTPEEEKAVFLRRLRPDVTDAKLFEEKFGVPPAEDTQLAAAVKELLAELGGATPTRAGDADEIVITETPVAEGEGAEAIVPDGTGGPAEVQP